jgi:hypothetical protein
MRVAVAAIFLALLGSSAFAADRRGLPSPASTPASADSAASTSSANAASANAFFSASSLPTATALVAATLPAEATPTEVPGTEIRTSEPSSSGSLYFAPVATTPSLDSSFVTTNSLASIHALVAPPVALIKLKTPPRTHSFFDSRNRLGLATLGASLTADALSTQKGLAYPGFVEMNPIARAFVQSRMGAAAYNAGSFGLMAGLMYWAHKKEHHKLERILPFAIGSWEGLLSARNYHMIANRTR